MPLLVGEERLDNRRMDRLILIIPRAFDFVGRFFKKSRDFRKKILGEFLGRRPKEAKEGPSPIDSGGWVVILWEGSI